MSIDGPCNITMSFRLLWSVVGAFIFLILYVTACLVALPMFPKADQASMTHRLRRSARVFLFDEHDRVLLIRFVAQREDGPFVFWVTPGGEIEPNEDEHTAAARELREELGIAPPLVGPVHQESEGTYVHLGETVANHDTFFAARTSAASPRLTGVTAEEIALMQEARWWSAAELAATDERVYPPQLAALLPAILARLCAAATNLPSAAQG